jgi:hypothetical protein
MKLGKLAPRHDRRTLHLVDYLTRALPPLPDTVAWGTKVPAWGMGGNDKCGDCTLAAVGNLTRLWGTDAAGAPKIIPDADLVAAYSAISGYDPATGANDNGCVVLEVLNRWRKQGIAGDQLGAYVSVEPTHTTNLQAAVFLFGAAYIGLALPLTAQEQFASGRPWTTCPGCNGPRAAAGSWGGHAVPIVGYSRFGVQVVTWAKVQTCSWPFIAAYCDEAYACLSADWIAKNGQAPSGFSVPDLQADLALVAA